MPERERERGGMWRALGSRRVYLSSKQKMRARRRPERGGPWSSSDCERRRSRSRKDDPSPSSWTTNGYVHCLSSDRNTIFFRERPRRARRVAPFRNRALTVADESILSVFASLRAGSFAGAPVPEAREDARDVTRRRAGTHARGIVSPLPRSLRRADRLRSSVFGRYFNPV